MKMYMQTLDNGVSSIKCEQESQFWLWSIVCINNVVMLINESELSLSINEYIAQYVEVTDI